MDKNKFHRLTQILSQIKAEKKILVSRDIFSLLGDSLPQPQEYSGFEVYTADDIKGVVSFGSHPMSSMDINPDVYFEYKKFCDKITPYSICGKMAGKDKAPFAFVRSSFSKFGPERFFVFDANAGRFDAYDL